MRLLATELAHDFHWDRTDPLHTPLQVLEKQFKARGEAGKILKLTRAFGRKEMVEVSQIASVGQTLSGLLGLLTAVLFVTCSKPVLRAATTSSNTVEIQRRASVSYSQ